MSTRKGSSISVTAVVKCVKCPTCDQTLALQPHPEKIGRVVAVCNCHGKFPARRVVDMDEKYANSIAFSVSNS